MTDLHRVAATHLLSSYAAVLSSLSPIKEFGCHDAALYPKHRCFEETRGGVHGGVVAPEPPISPALLNRN